ncbi:Glycosyl hydrolases family 18 [Aspergillus sp. HF37]|nr:Glycosyl hydrolases family 18 [Aspergillus sp. HF37]
MASTAAGRKSFAKSVLRTMQEYGFDGVDLDWEYPVSSVRGGSEGDKANLVHLIIDLRETLDASGQVYGITFTIPSSYWYLQHFDVPFMLESGADWANLMSYDLHGVWDGDNPYTEQVVGAHTNLTEIKQSLDLLWRVNVDSSKLVMGMGFYGRSFTLSELDCTEPGCPFEFGGHEGRCTGASGILSYKEITEIIESGSGELIWNEEAAINYMNWDGYQWVSFDTKKTFQQKVDYANQVCLGGVMIWALDQDTYDWQALSGLIGEDVDGNGLLSGGTLSDSEQEDRSDELSAYTGADCYVSECVDWSSGQCKPGYSVLDYVHSASLGVIENPDDELCHSGEEGDEDAQYRLICCPTDSMPKGCFWKGADEFGLCTGGGNCGADKFELVADSYNDRTGDIRCLINKRSLCCNTNPNLELCSWTSCLGSCPEDWVMNDWGSVYGGSNLDEDNELCGGMTAFCCPSEDTYKNCDWYSCDESCPSDKVLVTKRSQINKLGTNHVYSTCLTGYNKYCCDPPSGPSVWPVNPAYLFENPDRDDIMYYYKVQENANAKATSDDSEDPFAFVMINGDTDAYDESLVDNWDFLTGDEELGKRGLKRHERRNMFEHRDDTFENEVEVYHIRCNSLSKNSTACLSIFQGGASNTIVKMPKGFGAGPYARAISLVPLETKGTKRDVLPNSSSDTYELTVDYDLAAASEEQKGDVGFRIDYTNLLEYWEEVTNEPADKRKRWFGSFSGWLSKVTTMVKEAKGSLPMEYDEKIKLFHSRAKCPNLNIEASLDLDAYIHMGLYTQYGYYFEGSILPTPSLVSAYGYFSVEPAAEVLLTLRGEAVWQSTTGEVALISGVGFPGLSVKGLVSLGPELEVTGRMDASLSVSGELNAGVVAGWPRAEVYFPQSPKGEDATVPPQEVEDGEPQTYSFEPVFDASLNAEGHMALTLTPKVKFGVSVLGGNLMSGYVTAGVANTVSLGVSASASTSSDESASADFCYWADYVYSVFLRADMSFIDDLAYWGGEYNVHSPKDPLVLVDNTCISYSAEDALAKRDSSESLVENGDGEGCFGGLVSCKADSGDTPCMPMGDSGLSKRVNPPCYNVPALWYNCDFFGATTVNNRNQRTNQVKPNEAFMGICDNIRNYLLGNPSVLSGNGMELTYLAGKEQSWSNRKDACNAKSRECVTSKVNLWPTDVQSMYSMTAAGTPAPTDYQLMQGYDESISCDEFPFAKKAAEAQ